MSLAEQAQQAIGDVLYRFTRMLQCLTSEDELIDCAPDYHALMFSPWCDVRRNRPGYPWGLTLDDAKPER